MDGTLQPGAIALTALLSVCLVLLPRRWSTLPIFIGAAFIPADQRLIVATLDISMIRILILVGLARLAFRGELRPLRVNSVDAMVLALVASLMVTGTLLHLSLPAFVNRLGVAFDLLGLYFFTRVSLRSWSDASTTLTAGLACMVVLAALMTWEWSTGHNLFSVIGDVPRTTVIRQGRLRCQGAFAHPILAGVFAASWFPLAVWVVWARRRLLGVLGLIACVVVVMLSSSSTPVLALTVAMLGLALWRVRRSLVLVRWGAVALLLLIHLIREKPVWHLLARVNVLGGSTGWHRYFVIDRAIEHFEDWWLVGIPDVTYWGIHANDITNHYVLTGINGGILPLLLLIGLIGVGFRQVGRSAGARNLTGAQRRFAWALGATLFVHATVFISLAYFGQMTFVFYHHLALIGTAVDLRERGSRRRPTAVVLENPLGASRGLAPAPAQKIKREAAP